MKNKFNKIFIALVLAIPALFSSCKEDMPSIKNETFISIDADAALEESVYQDIDRDDTDKEGSELRSLNYQLLPSKSEKKHPSIELDYSKDAQVDIVAIIQNQRSGQKMIKNLKWRFINNQKDLKIDRKDGGKFSDAITLTDANKDDWKLFLIMGGEYNEQEKTVSFSPKRDILNNKKTPTSNNKLSQMSSIYMSSEWTSLSVAKGKNGEFEFKAKNKIHLRNVGSFFAISLVNQYTRKYIHSFDFSINNYRFSGKYNLAETVVGESPKLIGDEGSSNQKIRPIDKSAFGRNKKTGYFLLWGAPIHNDPSTIEGQVTLGDLIRKDIGSQDGNVEHSKPVQSIIRLEINKIYGIGIGIFQPAPKAHPIEQFRADANGNIITRYRNDAGVDRAIQKGDPGIEIESAGRYSYNVPEQSEYRIIAPGTKGGGVGGTYTSGERPIVEMYNTRQSFGEFTETVKAFGQEGTYTSHVKNTGGTHSYAIRFKGGNNQYYSAYHYEKQNGKVKITVRVLGPSRTNIGIDQVSNPSWWNQPIAGVREIVRYIPNGTWMSSTKSIANVHTLNVFPPKETAPQGHKENLEPRGVYTTEYPVWGRFPGLPQNKGFGTLLIADQK